jgi:predicted KAP-like P-loop ATPase
MPSKIWNKYKIIKEINSNSNIKTYLARIEPIIKEIIPKNKDDYYRIYERLEKLKEEINIYEIIEENEKIYIVIDNNDE